jgi:hypothetical protein
MALPPSSLSTKMAGACANSSCVSAAALGVAKVAPRKSRQLTGSEAVSVSQRKWADRGSIGRQVWLQGSSRRRRIIGKVALSCQFARVWQGSSQPTARDRRSDGVWLIKQVSNSRPFG